MTSDKALRFALDEQGFRSEEFFLLRTGENDVYEVPGLKAVARVSRPGVAAHRVRRSCEQADALRASGVSVSVTLESFGSKGVVETPFGCVALWTRITSRRSPTTADLGELLKSLRAAPIDTIRLDLQNWRPVEKANHRLERQLIELPRSLLLGLRDLGRFVTRLVDEYPWDTKSFVVSHGDAHLGNVIVGSDGPVLIDLDDLCLAPSEYDLAPSFVAARRITQDVAPFSMLIATLSPRPIDYEALQVLSRLREYTMTTWLAQQYFSNPQAGAEVERRCTDILEDRDDSRWRAF